MAQEYIAEKSAATEAAQKAAEVDIFNPMSHPHFHMQSSSSMLGNPDLHMARVSLQHTETCPCLVYIFMRDSARRG